jgi:hypothetical protein
MCLYLLFCLTRHFTVPDLRLGSLYSVSPNPFQRLLRRVFLPDPDPFTCRFGDVVLPTLEPTLYGVVFPVIRSRVNRIRGSRCDPHLRFPASCQLVLWMYQGVHEKSQARKGSKVRGSCYPNLINSRRSFIYTCTCEAYPSTHPTTRPSPTSHLHSRLPSSSPSVHPLFALLHSLHSLSNSIPGI